MPVHGRFYHQEQNRPEISSSWSSLGAWDHDKYSAQYLGTWTASETRSGWTVGAGLEWAFADNWSARFEYDYYGFGNRNVTFTNPRFTILPSIETVKQSIQTVTFGINYRFELATTRY